MLNDYYNSYLTFCIRIGWNLQMFSKNNEKTQNVE